MKTGEKPSIPFSYRFLRLTHVRIVSQVVFFVLFLLSVWASWTTRIKGYPVSRFLELDPLIAVSTLISTGYVYRFMGWSLLIVGLTFLFGRVFCNWICPFGTLHQFTGWLFHTKNSKQRIEQNSYRPSQYFKYAVLTVFLVMASFGSLQVGILDPIAFFYRAMSTVVAPANDMGVSILHLESHDLQINPAIVNALKFAPESSDRIFVGSFWIGLMFFALVSANLWMPRFFCRMLCPLGALLGLLSSLSLFRINRDVDKCTHCGLCLTRCEGSADPQGKVRVSECFSCLNCVDDCPEDALKFSCLGLDQKQRIFTPDFSRRRLLLAGLTGMLAFPMLRNNGGVTDQHFSPLMIRPPGSIPEPEFLKRCIKCGQCINICPTNVLQPAAFVEGGIEALWTPVMKFTIGHCQLKCTLCSEVCPTGAIRKITPMEKLGKGEYQSQGPVRLGTAFVNTTRCLPWANQIPCVVCEEVCPVSPKAIQTLDEEVKNIFGNIVVLNKPFIVPDLCIGCGICQSECPVADQPAVYVTAIGESRSTSRRLLLKYRNEKSGTD